MLSSREIVTFFSDMLALWHGRPEEWPEKGKTLLKDGVNREEKPETDF